MRKRLKGHEQNISVLSAGDILSEVTEWIPTSFPNLDHILGGGWAVGRASEVFGSEGSGKSALTHMAIKACQQQGGTALILDFETSLDPDKLEQLDIDSDRLIYCNPDHIEQAWDIVWETIDYLEHNQPKAPFLIVWDSIAASVPKAELEEKDSGASHIGLIARSMSKGCRKMFKKIAGVRAHIMWVNQERETVGGQSFFKEFVTPGGKAVRYAASIRVRTTRVSTLKQGDVRTGYLIRATTRKCRLAPPHQKANWVLDFRYGPSPELTMFQVLLDAKKIKSAGGGNYGIVGHKTKFKKGASFLQALADDPVFRQHVETQFYVVAQVAEPTDDETDDDA